MDTIFRLTEGDRSSFLHGMLDSFGCTYICLWTFLSQVPNCLIFHDGAYREESNRPSSSSGTTLARRLFDGYRRSIIPLDSWHVPGLAFGNNLPYLELKDFDLLRRASNEPQLQFYQEARIKTAIFMCCNTGEIEIGMSHDTQASFESEIKNWLLNVYLEQALPPPPPPDQSRAGPSSSSSSLRSLSMESPSELSPLFFNIPATNPYNIEPPIITTTTTIIEPSPLHQAIQTLSQIRNVQFPTIESEEAAMTKAFVAVISSSPSASSSSPSHHRPPKASAFRRYRSSNLAPRVQRENQLKRSIAFLRSLRNSLRMQRRSVPTSNQLNHMISERRRREKLNESFQVLKSLLPSGTKRDKASVLSATTEYLKSLKDQVEELNRLNQIMEARLPRKEAREGENRAPPNDQRVDVGITRLAESTSQGQVLDLHVNVRGECSMDDVVIRLLEFLKQTGNTKLMSVEATTEIVGTDSRIRIILRLKVEGDEWDESAFQEAVRRVVADLAQ